MARPNKPLQPTAYNLNPRAVKVGGGGCAGEILRGQCCIIAVPRPW
jgi:hypothetical protein